MKAANKGVQPAPAEWPEGRPEREGNSDRERTAGTQNPIHAVSPRLAGVREAARRDKQTRFTALMHHITPQLLASSFNHLSRTAATGVDGQTWGEYAHRLTERVADLHERVQSGRYRAQPSKRIYIPKADGRMRPIGIAALEDKIVQQALVTVLTPIYEEQFLGFSYGFRPGRGPHDALDALTTAIMRGKVNWIVDADIRNFFDTLDHGWLMKFVKERIADSRVLRLLGKWLRAGVSELGRWEPTTVGTPQGAVISPLLANIYLHHTLDQWVEQWRRQPGRGEVYIVRYADDFVVGFQRQDDAREMLAALGRRMQQHGLSLHEDKTRLIEFGRYASRDRAARGEAKPETFDFLGFTHACAVTRLNAKFTVHRIPVAKRLREKAKKVGENLRRMMHQPVAKMGRYLRQVMTGTLNYYAVPGTAFVLSAYRKTLERLWIGVLRRRSHKSRITPWKRYAKLLETWMPKIRITHPHPVQRFAAMHPGTFEKSRVR